MIDAMQEGLWALWILLGWVDEADAALENGMTINPDG